MTKYQRDRLRIWIVGVRNKRNEMFVPTSLKWFNTRKECQTYIDGFRSEFPKMYDNMEHHPMCYFPRSI